MKDVRGSQMVRTLPTLQTDQGISGYIQQITAYPILSQEEEHSLMTRVFENQDVKAAHAVVTSHLRLVVKMAMQMRGYGLSLMDLISEGNIGLMHAVKKFDPTLGYRFSTYAVWWIKSSMQEFVIKSWSLVKIGTTAAQRKLFFNLNKIKKKIRSVSEGAMCLSDAEIQKVSKQYNIPDYEVKNMDQRMSMSDVSLDTPIDNGSGGGGNSALLIDSIADSSEGQESILAEVQEVSIQRRALENAVSKLNDREREILVSRRLKDKPTTLEVLSEKYQVSKERIRQIETRALEKVKLHCSENALVY